MSREVQVRFCESRAVRSRPATHLVIMVSGTRAHAEDLKTQTAHVLAGMGLRLSEEKTTIVHIDEGFEFLGFRIQRQRKRGSTKRYVYTWPSKKSLTSVMSKVKGLFRDFRVRGVRSGVGIGCGS